MYEYISIAIVFGGGNNNVGGGGGETIVKERSTIRVMMNFLKQGHPFYQFWEEAQQCVKVKDMF